MVIYVMNAMIARRAERKTEPRGVLDRERKRLQRIKLVHRCPLVHRDVPADPIVFVDERERERERERASVCEYIILEV